MAMYDKKAYKNPKIAGGPGQIASAGQQAPSAPPRAGGMMQMAAQARARQPKPGQPPVPITRPFHPKQRPSEAPAGPAPAFDPVKQAAAKRVLSAGGKAMGGGPQVPGMNQVLTSLEPGTGITPAYAGGIDAVGTPVGDVGGLETPFQYDILKAEGSGRAGDAPVDPTGLEPTEAEKWAAFDQMGKDKFAQTAESQQMEPITGPKGEQVGWQDSAGQQFDLYGNPIGFFQEESEFSDVDWHAKGDELAAAMEDQFTDKARGQGMEPVVDANGNHIGWQDGEGNQFDKKGSATEPKDAKQTEGDYKSSKFQSQMESQFFDWLGESTGIPKEELASQVDQLKQASSSEIAKFAQQMAARGMGASGLVGQGMGQIASQTVGAIANLRFENAKLSVEEKLNKMKAYMAMYGQVLSEANRQSNFADMSKLEQEKFLWQQFQDQMENEFAKLNNLSALAQSWDDDALAYAFNGLTSVPPKTAAEIMSKLEAVEGDDGVVTLKLKTEEDLSSMSYLYQNGVPAKVGDPPPKFPSSEAINSGKAEPSQDQEVWAKVQGYENYSEYLAQQI